MLVKIGCIDTYVVYRIECACMSVGACAARTDHGDVHSMAVVASCGLELTATARQTLKRTTRSFSPAHTHARILIYPDCAHHVGRRG